MGVYGGVLRVGCPDRFWRRCLSVVLSADGGLLPMVGSFSNLFVVTRFVAIA